MIFFLKVPKNSEVVWEKKKELCLFEVKVGRIQARPQGRGGIIAKFKDKEVFSG